MVEAVPSIFIQIASYRDLELKLTVEDAIRRASKDNKLVFGIHECIAETDDITIFDFEIPDWVEIRYSLSIAPNNIGVSKTRYEANELYKDEDYYFQIDSHMRFMHNWDRTLISDYLWHVEAGIELPLMSMYPPNYYYTDADSKEILDPVDHDRQTRIIFNEQFHKFSESYIANQTAVSISKYCLYTASVSAATIFTAGSFGKIKPNRKIAFWGEELLTAARAFTHGYTPVVLPHTVVWHLYVNGQARHLVRRHHAWQDYPALWEIINSAAFEEVASIFSSNRISDDALGSVRTLDEFGEYAGLDFKNKKILDLPEERSTWR